MKKLLVLFLALSMVTFTSCKKDDDSVAKPTNTLIGKWKEVKDNISDCEAKNYIEFTETRFLNHVFDYDKITFTCEEEREKSIKYTIEGDKIKVMMKNEKQEDVESILKFKVSGDILTVYKTDTEGNEIETILKRM